LIHKQATALAGELYRAWAEEEREQTVSVSLTPQGWVSDHVTPDEDKAYFQAAIACLDRLAGTEDPQDFEPVLGAIVDRLLLAKGIASVDATTRPMLLRAFYLALRDALSYRERNADGDYAPDPKVPQDFHPR
jgi:hypothetical protein